MSTCSRRRRAMRRPFTMIGSRRRRCRSEEHTSELQSLRHLVCRLLLEKKKKNKKEKDRQTHKAAADLSQRKQHKNIRQYKLTTQNKATNKADHDHTTTRPCT